MSVFNKRSENQGPQAQYARLELKSASLREIPADKRIPFGWKSAVVAESGSGEATFFSWEGLVFKCNQMRMRITVALDVREEKLIEVFLPESGRVIGEFDIKYAYVFQPFEVVINENDAEEALKQGIGLRMIKGEHPLWIFYEEADGESCIEPAFLPHFLFEDSYNLVNEFYLRMLSPASIQPFGWMEGCVLDGLMDLEDMFCDGRAAGAVKAHLNKFFDANKRLVYENPRSVPVDGKVYGIEGTLPFAVIARVYPDHPALDVAVSSWCSLIDKNGAITDDDFLSAEGSYTVAYPLAVISRLQKRDDLAEMAVKQLLIRKDRLVEGRDLYLRCTADNNKTFKNWVRAYSWYMLGLIRTIVVLKDYDNLTGLKEEFSRISEIALSYRMNNGLWPCFLGEPETGVETSGSAGIASALAMGGVFGILPDSALKSAEKAFGMLKNYLTPDGFLSGISQSNRGGEVLQRSGYRVISQMGMGLLSQLAASVSKK